MREMDKIIRSVLERLDAIGPPYRPGVLLRDYLPDSLALVRFVVELEQVWGMELPFGSFEIGWLDKTMAQLEQRLSALRAEIQGKST